MTKKRRQQCCYERGDIAVSPFFYAICPALFKYA